MKRKVLSILLILAMVVLVISPAKVSAATKLKLSKAKAVMEIDSKLTLKLGDVAGKDVKWSSSAKKVATVSKSGVVTAKAEGTATIKAKYDNNEYSCKITVVDSNKYNTEPTPTPKIPSSISIPNVKNKKVYSGNDAVVYIESIKEESDSVKINLIVENNSKKDYSISVHEYAINGLMAGGKQYGSHASVPAGKKTKFYISNTKKWFADAGINGIETIDFLFWAYSDYFKSWESEQVRYSAKKDLNEYTAIGTKVYSDDYADVYYISKDKNTYKFCFKNKTGSDADWTIEGCSVNGWSYDVNSLKYDYDLFNKPILKDCYDFFEISVADSFMKEYDINFIEDIEFSINFENYWKFGNDKETEKISISY